MSLDPFRLRQMPDVAERLHNARKYHQQASDAMWRGILATFSDHELSLLLDFGVLSRHDQDLMRQAERPIASANRRPPNA